MIYALPTDTCYWLACSLHDEAGYHAIYQMKQRDYSKPLSIIVQSYDDIERYGIINDDQQDFLRDYPAPFTVLVRSVFHLPSFLDHGRYHTIAIRVAEACILEDTFYRDLTFPLFLTSANISGEKECHTKKEVQKAFKNIPLDIRWEVSQKQASSDIFSFIGDGTEITYLRNNHYFI